MPINQIRPPNPSALLAEGEKPKQPPPSVLPGPPEPPELYPGYTQELKALRQQAYQQAKTTRSAQVEYENAVRVAANPAATFASELFAFKPLLSRDLTAIERQTLKIQAESALVTATVTADRTAWKLYVLNSLYSVLPDPTKGLGNYDAFKSYYSTTFPQMDTADEQWLKSIFDRVSPLIPRLPAEFTGTTEEARANLFKAVMEEPKLELKAVHQLTVDELLKYIVPQAPALPTGMTTADMRGIMTELEFDEETQKELELLSTDAQELKDAYIAQSAFYSMLREGIVNATDPELSAWDWTKMLAIQPAMATFELLEKYFNILPRPLAAWAITHQRLLRKDSDTSELEELYQQYRELGEGSWQAYSKAFEEWGTNTWLKMGIETVFDPTTYIGWNIATKIGGKWPYIGKYIGATERGWNEAWDLPFKGLRQMIKKIPQTPVQRALSYGRQAFMDTRAYITRYTGKSLSRVSLPEIKEAFENAIQQATERPLETGDLAVRVGRYLTEHDFLTETNLTEWAKVVGGEGAQVTQQMVHDVNFFFDNYYRSALSSKPLAAKEAATSILGKLGVENTEANVTKMVSALSHQSDQIIGSALDVLKGETAGDVLAGVLRSVEDREIRKALSAEYAFALKAGRATAWAQRAGRLVDRVTRSTFMVKLERNFVAPMANQYLLFTNYGPFNVIETAMRSVMGGGEMLYPRASSPVDELVRFGDGLTNLPYEFITAQQEIGRLEIAIVDPKTNKTMVFSKGKIPFITKEVELPSGVKNWVGEKEVDVKIATFSKEGVAVRIGTRDYPIRSWQNWNDMFGDIGTKQRAYYLLTKNRQILSEIAPEQMQQIADIFERHNGELAGLASFSKGDLADIVRTLENDAVVGPNAVRAHAVPLPEWEKRRAYRHISKILDRATDVYSIQKQAIRNGIMDGTIWTDIDGTVAALKQSLREFNIASLVHETEVLNGLVADLANLVPSNSDELLRNLGFVTDLTDGIAERIADVRQITRSRARQLTGTEADDFYRASSEVLADFIGSSQSSIDKITAHIKDVARSVGRVDMSQITLDAALQPHSAKIQAMLEKLPAEFKYNIKAIHLLPDIGEQAVHAVYESSEKRIRFGTLADVNEETFFHELGHNHIDSLFEASRYKEANQLLIQFDDVTKSITPSAGLTERQRQRLAARQGYESSYNEFTNVHESFSDSFASWLSDPSSVPEQYRNFFDSAYPKKSMPPLTEAQITNLDALTDAVRLRHTNSLATRELDRRIINEAIDATPRRQRTQKWWDWLENKRQQEAWMPYYTRDEELVNQVEELKLGMMRSVGVDINDPLPIPDVPGRLTPAHVVYLFQTTGDDLNRALTRAGAMVTIRPKRQFVNWVYRRANRAATKVGKSPDQIGFTKEAIGNVYDQMFANLGIDPATAADPLSPAMLQMDEIGQELHRTLGTKGMPEDEYIRFKNYLNGVADDLEQLPMFQKAPALNLREEVHKSGATVLRDYDTAGKATGHFIQYRVTGNTMKIEGISVRETERRKGLGTKLYMVALQKARAEGLTVTADLATEEGAALVRSLIDRGLVTTDKAPVKMASVTFTSINPSVGAAVSGTDAWTATREQAMTKAREQYELDFTDYEHHNMVDASMRTIFPFWTYEKERWFWLPRAMIKRPGVATGIARYMNTSDDGYIPVPGTDIQFNPLRGSVFMGGFRRLMLRDYPEYYDAFPGMKMIDYIGRLGFYPGIHIMLPIIATGQLVGKPEWGEILPAWAKSGVDSARAIAPEQAGKVIDHFFPDRFRDYQTMLTLGELGYDADEIWRKKHSGLKLTPDEERTWLRAEAKATGWKGVLFEQGAIFRIRPQEYIQMQQEMKELLEELTGVPVPVQDEIQRQYPTTGKRFSDYYPLDALQQKIVYEQETFQRWQGITTPLLPSAMQQEEIAIRDYYEKVDALYTDYRKNGVFDEQGTLLSPSLNDITAHWVSGQIGPAQWVSTRGKLLSDAAVAVREMGKRAYPDVPKTLAEREERLAKFGITSPTYSPDQELLYLYFDIKPELTFNWESGRDEYDFDAYYAKIDIILESLTGEYRQRLLDRIQYDWNNMEKLYWNTSREFLRPYRMVRSLVMEQLPDDQRQAIRRYEVARGAEREALQQLPGPEGQKLISWFTSTTRTARQRLRMLDPELDAWTYFFGVTDTLLSSKSKALYEQYTRSYLTPAMAE